MVIICIFKTRFNNFQRDWILLCIKYLIFSTAWSILTFANILSMYSIAHSSILSSKIDFSMLEFSKTLFMINFSRSLLIDSCVDRCVDNGTERTCFIVLQYLIVVKILCVRIQVFIGVRITWKKFKLESVQCWFKLEIFYVLKIHKSLSVFYKF